MRTVNVSSETTTVLHTKRVMWMANVNRLTIHVFGIRINAFHTIYPNTVSIIRQISLACMETVMNREPIGYMMNKQLSISKKTLLGMLVFGISMGAIFPFYARLFTYYKEGMRVYFDLGCLGAGMMIGIISYALTKILIFREYGT